ncbi:hypothetical protein [Falsiroseomonas sp. HW251]|uniref:hypothetical protein n=1 Tax=Falsiroseomonas sp. HW251 TaxID=3390998 RepID=UPI003D30F80F
MTVRDVRFDEGSEFIHSVAVSSSAIGLVLRQLPHLGERLPDVRFREGLPDLLHCNIRLN